MKKFLVLVLTIIMALSMIPVSAIEYVAGEGESIEELMPASEATGSTSCDFTITGSLAKVTASYTGNSSFSYARVYLYVQKYVNGQWTAARSDVQCSWSGTYYEKSDEISKTVTLNSSGSYRGRVVIYMYSTSGTYDKWDLNKEKSY